MLPAILIVRDHLSERYWHFSFFNSQKIPDIKGFGRKISIDGTSRHPIILIEKDRFPLTLIAKFVKAVRDPFIQQQFHAIIGCIFESMVRAPSMEAFIHCLSIFEPIIILNLLDLSEEIRNELNVFGCNAYLKTVFNTMVNWLDPHYLIILQ